jgi:chemotaxis-related protein WspD
MNAPAYKTGLCMRPAVEDCWNRIGVRGDQSCIELGQHLHCRNCPVYAASARTLLDAPLPPDYSDFWTKHFARPSGLVQTALHSVIIFRVGAEWLALPTLLCAEVAHRRPIHPLPHRRSGAVLGVTNVRGELLVCLSLAAILGLDVSARLVQEQRGVDVERFLVIGRGADAVVFPVDAVRRMHRFGSSELTELPATVSRAQAAYTSAILSWDGRTAGVLDGKLLLCAVERSLA